MLLGDDLAVELVLLAFFFGEDFVAPRLEFRKADLQPPRAAAVEPYGDARQIFQKAPVMADEDERRAAVLSARFPAIRW